VRRGFVDAVRCTAGGWLRHGPAVVAAQPVTRVELGDKRPYPDGPGPGAGLSWALKVPWLTARAGSLDENATLPPELFEATGGRQGNYADGQPFVSYGSRAEAGDVLSAACLAWARGRNL
jgi:hypothetical protein